MLTRYDTYGLDWKCETYADEKGPLVAYEDYLKLESEIKELRRQLEAVAPAKDDGWIQWKGNGLTMALLGKIVKVRYQDTNTDVGPTSQFYWGRNCGNPIIAYRVVS